MPPSRLSAARTAALPAFAKSQLASSGKRLSPLLANRMQQCSLRRGFRSAVWYTAEAVERDGLVLAKGREKVLVRLSHDGLETGELVSFYNADQIEPSSLEGFQKQVSERGVPFGGVGAQRQLQLVREQRGFTSSVWLHTKTAQSAGRVLRKSGSPPTTVAGVDGTEMALRNADEFRPETKSPAGVPGAGAELQTALRAARARCGFWRGGWCRANDALVQGRTLHNVAPITVRGEYYFNECQLAPRPSEAHLLARFAPLLGKPPRRGRRPPHQLLGVGPSALSFSAGISKLLGAVAVDRGWLPAPGPRKHGRH